MKRGWVGALGCAIITGMAVLVSFPSGGREQQPNGWYGSVLCADTVTYDCITVEPEAHTREIQTSRGPRTLTYEVVKNWEHRWPDEEQRLTIMKINRMNYRLRSGYQVAVPKNMEGKTLLDFSPFPATRKGGKVLIMDLSILAFAAYDRSGTLVRWGPTVGGKSYCSDVRRSCRSPVGNYSIESKFGPEHRSGKYPVGSGGAPMPYAMYYCPHFAIHGGPLPGRHASHGCIRVFYDDAQWLNKEFAKVGTRVQVKPYGDSLKAGN